MSASILRDGILNEDTARTSHKGHSHRNHDQNRTRSPSALRDEDMKHEETTTGVALPEGRLPDSRITEPKPTYKSWKKKYRKMRIKFDLLQAQNEELYQMEQKALKKTKQLAIYNDRMLDLLLDINNRPQIPTEKRIDLSLPIPSDAEDDDVLPIDKEPRSGPRPAKALRDMLNDVPHVDFATTRQRFPEATQELLTGIDSPAADAHHKLYPPQFLTADDIDNYLWEIDNQAAAHPELYGELHRPLPSLAPLARDNKDSNSSNTNNTAGRGITPAGTTATAAGASSVNPSSRDFALRNPTSVYNWLRKHAPKTFLQDHEGGDDSSKKERGGGGGGDKSSSRKAHRADNNNNNDDDDDDDNRTPAARKGNGGGGGARKASGETKASAAARGAAAASKQQQQQAGRSLKRSKAAKGKDKRKSMDETMDDLDDEIGFEASIVSSSAAKGAPKRKRVAVDDDTGYRPKGGSSRRPAKKRVKQSSSGAPVAGGEEGGDGAAAEAKKDGEEANGGED